MSSVLRLRFFAVVAALTLLVLATPAARAQQTDRSGIEGKVVDETGAVLPGVTVTISSPALQAPQLVASTDQKGLYRFTALPLGVYTVTYELSGFQTVRREGIRLTAGFIATVDIEMSVGAIEETVTVTGESPVVDVRTTAPSTSFTTEALDTVPTSRTVWDVISLSPGMRMTSEIDVGGNKTGTQTGFNNYGSGRGGNRPTIDGVNTQSGGTATAMDFYHDFGAFEEVQIKGMANDAEMPLSGTNFAIIIKSGGNDFHGGALFQYEGPTLQSNNVDDALRAQGITEGNPLIRYYDFNAELGGRVVRDHVWFYGSYRKNKIRSGVIGYSRTAGPDGIFGTADDEPGENETNLTPYTVKVTAQPTPKHKLQSFLQYSNKLYPERGGSALRPAESTIRQAFKPFATKLEWTYIPNETSIVNFLVGRNAWTSAWDPAYPEAGPAYYDTVTRRYWGSSMLNDTSTSERSRWQLTGSYSYYKTDFLGGDHDFKLGVELAFEQYSRLIKDRGDAGNYTLRMQNGVPFQIDTLNSPLTGLNNMNGQFAYFKDSWRIGDRLTLNLGVRVDRYHSYLPAQSKEPGEFSEAGDFPEMDIQTWSGIVPRVALSYALTSDLRNVVKASYGRFNFPGVPDVGRAYNLNDAITTRYMWNDLNGDLIFQPGELGDFVSRTGASNRVLNPDLKQPKTDEITATFEREVMTDLSARVSYVYKREFDLYQDVNLARPYEVYNIPITTTDPGPDGKVGTGDDGGSVTYYDYDPAYSGPEFERITYINTPDYTDHFHNIELSAQKRLSNNWQMLGSFLATRMNQYRTVNVATGSGSLTSGFLQYGGIPQDPNTANFFPKIQTWEWAFKLSGSYLFPYGIQLASSFVHQSGDPWAREVRFTKGLDQLSQLILLMEPVGSQRRPNVNLLSIRLEKRQELAFGEVSFHFDLYNALNTNVATNVEDRSGPTFNKILSIVPPRIARVGVTYRF